ncbi:MAG TPA: hypothetical protein VHE37_13005, partial [Nevskiaceae bacterium]|nr:hypothetical protein [Nevskiaceae bacterium]
GDTLATVTFTDGSTDDVKAGQGLSIAAGVHMRPERNAHFDLRALVGYKYETTKADNADIHISRVTWELLPTYRFDGRWWASVGLAKHTGVKLTLGGFGPDVKLHSNVGPELQIGWSYFALTYTSLRYSDDFGDSAKANSFGIRFTSAFGDNCCGWHQKANSSPTPPTSPYAPPPASVPVPLAPAAVSAPPALQAGMAAASLPGAQLRKRPLVNDAGTALAAGSAVTLEQAYPSEAGSWWYVGLADGSHGWLREGDVGPAPAPATP